jgi:hypothetical protein
MLQRAGFVAFQSTDYESQFRWTSTAVQSNCLEPAGYARTFGRNQAPGARQPQEVRHELFAVAGRAQMSTMSHIALQRRGPSGAPDNNACPGGSRSVGIHAFAS